MTQAIEEALGGKFKILEKIAEGGVGAIYKAQHSLLEEIRVIKVLRPQLASVKDNQQRFLQEAKTAIRLQHPNIAQLHDFSMAEGGLAYIVMEYIDGLSLDRMLKTSGPPSVPLALEIALQGLKALSFLHQNHYIHRDISPDNLMLSRDEKGAPVVKLIDLGIAKHLGEASGLTATGMFLGKIRYSSPEQLSGKSSNLDQRSDVYSYGVLLFELLTGEHPIPGKSFSELATGHVFNPPRGFAEADAAGRVPEALREIILRCLEKDPDLRPLSAEALAEELEGHYDPQGLNASEVDEILEAGRQEPAEKTEFEQVEEAEDDQLLIETTPSPTPRPVELGTGADKREQEREEELDEDREESRVTEISIERPLIQLERCGDLYHPGPDVTPPALLSHPDTSSPQGVKLKRPVVFRLAVKVNQQGRVEEARVESGPFFQRPLRRAALEAASQATFQPATKDGVAGCMWTQLRVPFTP